MSNGRGKRSGISGTHHLSCSCQDRKRPTSIECELQAGLARCQAKSRGGGGVGSCIPARSSPSSGGGNRPDCPPGNGGNSPLRNPESSSPRGPPGNGESSRVGDSPDGGESSAPDSFPGSGESSPAGSSPHSRGIGHPGSSPDSWGIDPPHSSPHSRGDNGGDEGGEIHQYLITSCQ